MNRLLLGLCLVGVAFNVFAQQSKDSKSDIDVSSAKSINQGNEGTGGLHGRGVPRQNGWMKSGVGNTGNTDVSNGEHGGYGNGHNGGKDDEHQVNSDEHAQGKHRGDGSVHNGGKADEHQVNSDEHAQGKHRGDGSVHNGGKADEHKLNSDEHAQGGHGGEMDEGGKGAVYDGKSPDGHDHNEHGDEIKVGSTGHESEAVEGQGETNGGSSVLHGSRSKDWRGIKNSEWENSANGGNKGSNEQDRGMESKKNGEHGEQTKANSIYKGIMGNEGGSGSKNK